MRPATHLCCTVDISAGGEGWNSYCVKLDAWHVVLEVTNFQLSQVFCKKLNEDYMSQKTQGTLHQELHCRATGLQDCTCLAEKNSVTSTMLLFSLYSLTQWGTQVHKMLSNVFMALSLTEATPGLNLKVANNTLMEKKQSWAMEKAHGQDCAQGFCTVFRRRLREGE